MRRKVVSTKLVLVSPKVDKDQVKQEERERIGRVFGLFAVYTFLTVAAILAVFPFFFMISASMMMQSQIESGKILIDFATFIDTAATNYAETFTRLDYFRHVGTTLLIAVTTTVLQLLTTILAAFAFARLNFKGRDVLFIFFLATMMVPGELLAITIFLGCRRSSILKMLSFKVVPRTIESSMITRLSS